MKNPIIQAPVATPAALAVAALLADVPGVQVVDGQPVVVRLTCRPSLRRLTAATVAETLAERGADWRTRGRAGEESFLVYGVAVAEVVAVDDVVIAA